MENIKKTTPVKSAASKPVRFIAAVTAIVIVIALILSLMLSYAPSNVLEFDMTANSLYGVTPATRALLDSLEHDIEILVINDESTLDERFIKFMNKYDALSDKVTVTMLDPVKQPSVIEKYGVSDNTVRVNCAATGKSSTFEISGFDGQSTAALLYDYMSYMMYGALNMITFDAEGRLAAAINSVIGEGENKIYYLAGHGETELASQVKDLIGKSNYKTDYLELLTQGSIPDDCSLIICNAPSTDLADSELSLIRRWMTDGGKMMLICDDPSLENFGKLMQTYGIDLDEGHLADPKNYYENYVENFGYYCFYPVLNSESSICQGVKSSAMVLSARPLIPTTPDRRNSVAEYFMVSSDAAVSFVEGQEQMLQGIFGVGAVVTEELADDVSSRFTVISTRLFVDEGLLSSFGSISNLSIFMNALNANFEDAAVTIPAKNVSIQTNSFVSTTMWTVFFVGIVPGVFIVSGLVFWTKRRKK